MNDRLRPALGQLSDVPNVGNSVRAARDEYVAAVRVKLQTRNQVRYRC